MAITIPPKLNKEMMKRILKSILSFAGKVFHDRRIVIVSEGKASTILISRNFQIILAVVIVAALCWVPFSAGKIAAFSDLSGRKAIANDLDNYEQRVDVLQNDILLLEEYLRALHKYDNFELNNNKQELHKHPGDDEVSELEDKRDEILVDLKKRTLIRIVTIENFLHSANLDYSQITGKPQYVARFGSTDNTGGPYQPVSVDDIAKTDQEPTINSEFIDQLNYLFELQKIVNNLPFSNPVAYKKISSPFGIRHDPFNGSLSMHSGMDLQGDSNSQIAATGPGRVTWASSKGAYGNMVEIDHGFGYTTRYGHLSAIKVKVGDAIERGQIVGTQGCTGRCTGEHVHYEVRIHDVPVNPVAYLAKSADIQYYYAKKL